MDWWIWIVLGVLLLVAEVVISADFYLVFFGLSAILVGLLDLFGVMVPVWGQWLIFAGLAIISLILYRQMLRPMLLTPDSDLEEELIGKVVQVQRDLPVGKNGEISMRGSVWKVLNVGTRDIRADEDCMVEEVEGLILKIRPSHMDEGISPNREQ